MFRKLLFPQKWREEGHWIGGPTIQLFPGLLGGGPSEGRDKHHVPPFSGHSSPVGLPGNIIQLTRLLSDSRGLVWTKVPLSRWATVFITGQGS